MSRPAPATLEDLTGPELVTLAATSHARVKDVGAELKRRPADRATAESLIVGFREGRVPPWMTAFLLGCARALLGYDIAREILLLAPGSLAESYAGPAMARIAGVAAEDDLRHLVLEAPRLVSREGAAHGLGVLARPGTASFMLRAAQAGRVRHHTAAAMVARDPDVLPFVLECLAAADVLTETIGLHAGVSLLAGTAGKPDEGLVAAMGRSLEARRVKLAPATRASIVKRIARRPVRRR